MVKAVKSKGKSEAKERVKKRISKDAETYLYVVADLNPKCEYLEDLQCYAIESPLFVQVTPSTKFSMNMNEYRNTYWRTLNDAKIMYGQLMRDKILSLPKMNKISVDYEITIADNYRHDGMNITSVTSKFFLDALVENGIIVDDDMKHVVHEEWNPGPEDVVGKVTILIYPVV